MIFTFLTLLNSYCSGSPQQHDPKNEKIKNKNRK